MCLISYHSIYARRKIYGWVGGWGGTKSVRSSTHRITILIIILLRMQYVHIYTPVEGGWVKRTTFPKNEKKRHLSPESLSFHPNMQLKGLKLCVFGGEGPVGSSVQKRSNSLSRPPAFPQNSQVNSAVASCQWLCLCQNESGFPDTKTRQKNIHDVVKSLGGFVQ